MAKETEVPIEIYQIKELNLSVMAANFVFLDISSYCSIFIMSQYVYMEKFKYKIFGCNKTCPSVIE